MAIPAVVGAVVSLGAGLFAPDTPEQQSDLVKNVFAFLNEYVSTGRKPTQYGAALQYAYPNLDVAKKELAKLNVNFAQAKQNLVANPNLSGTNGAYIVAEEELRKEYQEKQAASTQNVQDVKSAVMDAAKSPTLWIIIIVAIVGIIGYKTIK